MNFWKRLFFLGVGLLYFSTTTVAQAQTYSLLPNLDTVKFPTERACSLFLDDFEDRYFFKNNENMGETLAEFGAEIGQGQDFFTRNDVLACSIKTGRIKMAYVKYFLTFFLSLGAVAAGVVAMLFVIIGGYKYTFSGLTDGKEEAKKTIIYAVVGLALTSMAWIIIQLVQTLLTGG
ncbi:hypothetical protein COV81_02170 [Candidatus Peregrinibacteria bacterium CG11_big_fil_rev_8_21_14_0_20_41_10]|nr:MAG: hypothetical protein COV81_02170 [Candidatus Peregrinibacteria bacterium CG11_big_fil_rev_8_21_14_0_20_41_10]PIZ73375.1 MAG: hypothetical protein COY06_05435 [Candidatus Peregrinibacteria bacterium CG_4_10_14_0_2_um_filter_41_8]PJC37637.1 MAG: hypothetical protein CO045_04610 [Candidatus Peregrinibacteria bacterium CG_4_9_14_0_2_um_filter_41_14]